MVNAPQVVFVTGASSGIGAAAARELAARGHRVIATMRNPKRDGPAVTRGYKKNLEAVRCDVTDRATVDEAVAFTLERHGRIDALVNNAGYLLLGTIEDLSDDEILSQFDTNVVGSMRTVQAVLPAMREQGSGTIINVSSAAGRMTGPAFGGYSATKYAIEAVSEALRFEVAPWGIKVVIVEPGTHRTEAQFDNLRVAQAVLEGRSLYQGPVEALIEGHRRYAAGRPGPRSVGSIIADLVETGDPLPVRVPVGDEAAQIFSMRAAMTDEEFETALRNLGNEGFPGAYFAAEHELNTN